MREDKINETRVESRGGSRKGSNRNSRSKPAILRGKVIARASSSSKEKSQKSKLPVQKTFPTEPDLQQQTLISGEEGAIPLEMLAGPAEDDYDP